MELIDLFELLPLGGLRELQRKLQYVTGTPAFKLCLVYENPWWQNFTDNTGAKKGWTDGYSVTDLPVRQVFYGMGMGPVTEGNQRVLLATYADTDAALYWEGLAQVSSNVPRLQEGAKFVQAGPGKLVRAVERQLCALLQINGPLPQPLFAGFMNWAADPYGGAWHEWQPGVNLISAIPEMRQPIPGLPVYLCGEAYSWVQAWIEGALMSAERMLEDHFQLPRPTGWLPADYDLGP